MNFPQVDDLRFIKLREVEVEDGLSQAILQLRNKKVSCVPNTPNTTRSCIGALVQRRDGKIWAIGVAKQGNINLNKKCSKVESGKREHKRYCKGGNKA